MTRTKLFGGGASLIALATGTFWLTAPDETVAQAANASAVTIPEFSQPAQSGEIAFNEYCAACHGKNAVGTDQGPPFLHRVYEPNHHGDGAFFMAAQNGVRAHHWRFGDMPPVEGVTETQLRWIVKYIRELQAANGVF